MAKIEVLIARARTRSAHHVQLHDFPEDSIPDAIADLKCAEEIHISGCPNLISLPDSLADLPNLRKLTIVHAGITTLPHSIGQLHTLTSLRVDECPLELLSDSIGNLHMLEHLYITGCRLQSIPHSIGKLHALRVLAVRGNRLRNLPEEIGGLSSLETIYASGNWLQSIPDSIGNLTIKELILRGNYLTSLPTSIGALNTLAVLRLAHNRLHTLPESMMAMKGLHTLEVWGNDKLGLPVEILVKPAPDILTFFFRSSHRRQLNEAKILLVGQGGVGKTSLVNRLLDNTFDKNEAKTEGIRIRDWSVGVNKTVKLNVWDFGGQEIMHATHQFFLTKRSLYILVLDARAGERESNIHYWLEMISIYGAQSPLLVVLNKSEEHYDRIDENRLRLDYKDSVNFVGFHTISCKTGSGIESLNSDIERAVRMMPHVSDYLPEDYFRVKQELESRAKHTDFITERQYAATCRRNGVNNSDEQRRLLRFLHDLGSVLHYDDPEQHYHVHDTRVLNPAWVTGGVYRILNDAELLRNGTGIVTQADLIRLLDPSRYPEHRYRFLIDIMRKYELCIAFPEDPVKVLVPELLSKNEPDVGWRRRGQTDVLEFEYHYGVLPRGLIPRFIVRAQHLLTENRTVWRAGAVLGVEECRVLVRGDIRKARVFIQVQGPKDNRRRALAVVRDAFRAVHPSYGDLSAEAKVPLPEDPDAPPVDYRHLLKLERESVGEYLFEKAHKLYNIKMLLDGIDENRFDVFLSHNSNDKPAVRELARLLQEQGVRYWLDEEQLRPGQRWQREIASAIKGCNTLLVIVGVLGVGPWEEEESALGLDQAAHGKKAVIPILLPQAPPVSDLPAQFAFLANRTWMDFRNGFAPEMIERLVRAILDRRQDRT